MKQHLGGKSGEVGPCKKVSGDVRYQTEEALKAITEKNKRNEESNPFGRAVFKFEDDVEVEEIIPLHNNSILINDGGSSRNKSKATMTQRGKGKEPTKIDNFFAPKTTTGSQPTIKGALATKETQHRAHMILEKFLYDTCVPMNVVNSIYFQPMFVVAIAIGLGYKVPTYHEIRVPLLNDSKKEFQLFIDSIKNIWADTGCTIMGDGSTNGRHRTLTNFLVYCPRGITFVKSIDASNVVKDATLLFKLFEEIIKWVGVSNIAHMVIDNGANYVGTRRLVS
ncbi:uncharacterized protein LOC114323211 [Camellia sinensis]|uniref:uncharacterized protein LOC114323211 n=1 Tax=Camellia sinensis TaxID=4442 RepID=UPI001036C91B|nr:uncharacterized protein LOC114323211 [Camellia sinensis]